MTDIEIFKQVTDIATLDKAQIAKITARLPEYKRGSSIIGHSTSQSSYSLQTMQMISDSPLSKMKQCLAQINQKYNALQEAYYRIENKKLEILILKNNTDKESMLKIRELESNISTVSINMENSLREIGMFQDMYDSIKKNNNIPDNWTEEDFENQEISHMIKSSFRLGIQDLSSTGRVSHAVVEYWEQLGIHPQLAEIRVRDYLVETQEAINRFGTITIERMYIFLDNMATEFTDAHEFALKRIGLDELGSKGFMANGQTKPT